ncbi:NAD(P)-binding protein [Aspergillus sclerotioniger CBS 115572]|uniref:NAD(P)-binding protein n=1 Tax=Aspergillus sclerotioniger CBS 115572 TaxID=1450535 RepID=A0A317X4K2_9EURO|nr:NAD(P)-binding protein [Aspergillus sclerotioniger CBS 115572]PWY93554.1 NAD(P)-binding protein [Aspergillus sclerotioniger CBS 115572]
MTTPERKYYLVTGASRGLGIGLVQQLLGRPETTVIAAVRDIESASPRLLALPNEKQNTLIIEKLDSANDDDALTVLESLKEIHQIPHLDVIIANAGMSQEKASAAVVRKQAMRDHFNVNAIAVLLLYQATKPLLRSGGKFVAISSTSGSILDVAARPSSNIAYGSSKAALNYIIRKIYFQDKDLITFPVHPGWVQTDMGNSSARKQGLEQAPVTVEESTRGILDLIDNATRENSNRFLDYNGDEVPWSTCISYLLDLAIEVVSRNVVVYNLHQLRTLTKSMIINHRV